MNENNLTVMDGIRFGIGFALAPLIIALFAVACIAVLGGCGAILSVLGS